MSLTLLLKIMSICKLFMEGYRYNKLGKYFSNLSPTIQTGLDINLPPFNYNIASKYVLNSILW